MKERKMLRKLKEIEVALNDIGRKINREGYICMLELNDRQRKGLTGEAAITHYNEWMAKYNLKHLMTK